MQNRLRVRRFCEKKEKLACFTCPLRFSSWRTGYVPRRWLRNRLVILLCSTRSWEEHAATAQHGIAPQYSAKKRACDSPCHLASLHQKYYALQSWLRLVLELGRPEKECALLCRNSAGTLAVLGADLMRPCNNLTKARRPSIMVLRQYSAPFHTILSPFLTILSPLSASVISWKREYLDNQVFFICKYLLFDKVTQLHTNKTTPDIQIYYNIAIKNAVYYPSSHNQWNSNIQCPYIFFMYKNSFLFKYNYLLQILKTFK